MPSLAKSTNTSHCLCYSNSVVFEATGYISFNKFQNESSTTSRQFNSMSMGVVLLALEKGLVGNAKMGANI